MINKNATTETVREDPIFDLYIEYLKDFLDQLSSASERCCGSLRLNDQNHKSYVRNVANGKGFATRIIHNDGETLVAVWKRGCFHFMPMGLPTITVSDFSRVKISRFLSSNQVTINNRCLMSPNFYRPSMAPSFPPSQFCRSGYLRNRPHIGIIPTPEITEQDALLLTAISNNRVVVAEMDSGHWKSVDISKLIFHAECSKRLPCRIVSVEANRLACLANLAKALNDLGEHTSAVKYQVHMDMQDCENASIVFTSSTLFLRHLAGTTKKKTFDSISHIVINDADAHNPYTDLLMYEVKEILAVCPVLKVIVIITEGSNILKYSSYFNTSAIVRRLIPKMRHVDLMYIDEIISRTVYSLYYSTQKVNSAELDEVLSRYIETGDTLHFNKFLRMVEEDFISINVCHSSTKMNALMGAIIHNNDTHLDILLAKNARFTEDPDKLYNTVFDYAILHNNSKCLAILNQLKRDKMLFPGHYDSFVLKQYETCRLGYNELEVDNLLLTHLLTDIIRIRCTLYKSTGNILVFLPSYESLVRQQCCLLREQLIGRIPSNIKIMLVHEDMNVAEYKSYLQSSSLEITVILATEIAETIVNLPGVEVVVDTGRIRRKLYNPISNDSTTTLQWISKENAHKRSEIIVGNQNGMCYRLYSSHQWAEMGMYSVPGMQVESLDRITLYSKMLSDCNMMVEYLKKMVCPPPQAHVVACIKNLKLIDVLDENEGITWLGVKLLDIPIDVKLGKALIYAIVLKCLDPVLTIVAALSCSSDPLQMPNDGSYYNWSNALRVKMATCRLTLSEETESDLFIYVRLLQRWHRASNNRNNVLPITDEQSFVFNKLMERNYEIRCNLMRVLRFSKLIHSYGAFSLHNVVNKSNHWSLVKSCFVSAFYPKIFISDRATHKIFSRSKLPLIIASNSVLKLSATVSQSEWVVCWHEHFNYNFNIVRNCTKVSAISLALFAGPIKLPAENLVANGDEGQSASRESSSLYCIDEWLAFSGTTKSCQAVLDLRLKFNQHLQNYLEGVSSSESQDSTLIDMLMTLVETEDSNENFISPLGIGERPLPHAIPSSLTGGEDTAPKYLIIPGLNINPGIQSSPLYFIITVRDETQAADYYRNFYKYPGLFLAAVQCYIANANGQFFVFMFANNRAAIISVGKLVSRSQDGAVYLQEIFRNKVPYREEQGQRIDLPCEIIPEELGKSLLLQFAFSPLGLCYEQFS